MYKVYARFEGFDMAEHACTQVLDRVSGVSKIGTRRIDRSGYSGEDSLADNYGAAMAKIISPDTLFQTGMWTPMGAVALGDVAGGAKGGLPMGEPDSVEYLDRARRGITGNTSPERRLRAQARDWYLVCAEGEQEAVNAAARMFRSMGGININICDAPGEFLR